MTLEKVKAIALVSVVAFLGAVLFSIAGKNPIIFGYPLILKILFMTILFIGVTFLFAFLTARIFNSNSNSSYQKNG